MRWSGALDATTGERGFEFGADKADVLADAQRRQPAFAGELEHGLGRDGAEDLGGLGGCEEPVVEAHRGLGVMGGRHVPTRTIGTGQHGNGSAVAVGRRVGF